MTENNFSFTPMANEDISIHIGSVPGAAAESGAPVASASPVSAQQPEAESIFGEIPAVPTQEAVDGIRHKSWKLDLWILYKTVWAVIGGRGAF